jgi:high affinity sulfate transporter 1
MFQGLRGGTGRASANLIAGFTLAAIAIPEVMGYTRISCTPVITGLYTLLIPMALYALFGSSRHLVVAADSATAAILASGLWGMAAPNSTEWLALAGLLALMSAALLFLARLARLGFLANFLSRTVLIGFLSGVGVQVALGSLYDMLGLKSAEHGGFLGRVSGVFSEIGHLSVAASGISIGVLVTIVVLRSVNKNVPGAMIAVVAGIALAWVFHLQDHGVAVLGSIPTGLPKIGMPRIALSWPLIEKLFPTAFAMFVVILTQSAATARAYAERSNESFNENADLVGLGLANIGAGLSGTFVVNGSPTKTQIVDSAGGSSQLAQITACAIVLLALLFLTGPLAFLPKAVLSTVVFLIGVELIDVKGMKKIFKERPFEFWVALTTATSVVIVGVEQGILLAIVLSLIVHTRHGYLVKNLLLVSSPEGWRQKNVETGQQAAPGLMIYRFLHNMYYANTHVLLQDITGLIARSQPRLIQLCIDMAAVNDVDFTAAEALRALHSICTAKKVRIVFCELSDSVPKEFERSGLIDLFGSDAFFPTLDAVIETYLKKESPLTSN